MPQHEDVHVDAKEAAVYLSSVVGRPIGVPYVRVLAHRNRWARTTENYRVAYLLADVEATADRMTTADHVI